MKNLIGLFLLLFNLAAPGQEAKPRYSGLMQAGLLEGENGSAFQLQTVQGLRYKAWKVGIGAGLDYYSIRSIPLFLDVRKTFGGKEAVFIYGDGGYHFPWLTADQKLNNISKSAGGLYYDAGVGYAVRVKRTALSFSLGYSYKAYRTTWEYPICPFAGPCFMQTERLRYQLRRLSLKTGLSF